MRNENDNNYRYIGNEKVYKRIICLSLFNKYKVWMKWMIFKKI